MKTKKKSTVARRRVKRRQARVSHKKLRTLRSRKYARKTARKVMRGGLFIADKQKIKLKAYGNDVDDAFTLSYRKSFTNKTTVLLLELVIDINKYQFSISFILDRLLSHLFETEYNLKLNSSIFDNETRKKGIEHNETLLKYTSGNTYENSENIHNVIVSRGIYDDRDKKVIYYDNNSDMDQLFKREIDDKKIKKEIYKMNKTIESKVSFSISIENKNITIKELTKTTIVCIPATLRLQWYYTRESAGVHQRIADFCEVSHDVDTEFTSPEITSTEITIESIIKKLTKLEVIHATTVEDEKKKAKEVADAEAEQLRQAAKAKAKEIDEEMKSILMFQM